MQMYVASAGTDDPNGIYRCTLNTDSGEIHIIDSHDALTNCLYLALHPTQPLLCAVGEGQIVALRVADDGGLSRINQQSTNGDEPCYVAFSNDGRYALVVNYLSKDGAGSILVYPIAADGSIAPPSQQVSSPYDGVGVHPTRQDASHPHMILPMPAGDLVLVPDLGTDKVMIYHLDSDDGTLYPHTQPHIDIQAGSGPRHLAFHPTQPIFYVLSELQPVLTVVSYDTNGRFETLKTYPTLPSGAAPEVNQGADIHVTPDGRYVIASNRGHDSLAIYAIDSSGRHLTYVGHQSPQGSWTRGFAITPSGKLLIAANQHTNDIHTFHISPTNGALTPTGYQVTMSAPVCVKIAPNH